MSSLLLHKHTHKMQFLQLKNKTLQHLSQMMFASQRFVLKSKHGTGYLPVARWCGML